MSSVRYSIVIPTLNERENIVQLLKRIEGCGLQDFEILVVDENSPDGTCQAVNDYGRDKSNIHGILNDGMPAYAASPDPAQNTLNPHQIEMLTNWLRGEWCGEE